MEHKKPTDRFLRPCLVVTSQYRREVLTQHLHDILYLTRLSRKVSLFKNSNQSVVKGHCSYGRLCKPTRQFTKYAFELSNMTWFCI